MKAINEDKPAQGFSPMDSVYKPINPGPIYTWPMGIWLIVFFLIPLIIILTYSFLKNGLYGGVEWEFTLKAYKKMFNRNYLIILGRTLWISAVSTLITIMIAIPCGYAMAKSKHQTVLLFLVIIPFWTNSLIRIFAWMTILSSEGILNTALMKLGLTSQSLNFLYNRGAVILVSVYMYLPYAILPIFTSVDKFDFSLLEASRDLGATKFQSMMKVLMPSIKSGIITAVTFTFIPIFGAYTVPLLVGGTKSYMIGNIIVDYATKLRNWPLAAAFSMIITIISTACIMWMLSASKKDAQLKSSKKKA